MMLVDLTQESYDAYRLDRSEKDDQVEKDLN